MADTTKIAVPPGPGSISTHATGAMTSQKATDGSAAGESPASQPAPECYVPASAKLRELAAENAQLRAMLIQKETDAVNRALEEAAALCEARADAGMASGSWDGGISAWDAAQILAAAIRERVSA